MRRRSVALDHIAAAALTLSVDGETRAIAAGEVLTDGEVDASAPALARMIRQGLIIVTPRARAARPRAAKAAS